VWFGSSTSFSQAFFGLHSLLKAIPGKALFFDKLPRLRERFSAVSQ